ncbi:MAG: sulfatase [Bacteroidota bacterium]
MKLRTVSLLVGIILYNLVLPPLSAQESPDTPRPNILLILVDDLKPTLGTYGDPVAISPHIDQLAREGVQFNKAYANQAICAPSRYNLLLGSRSTSTGFYGFGKQFRDVYPNAITLPQHFKNESYHVESMGKVFHIGHGNTNDERSWSIPHHKEKVIEYLLPESTNRELTREEAFFENTRLYLDHVPKNKALPRGAAWEMPDVVDDAYADGRIARHAIDRLRALSRHPEQPFFMALGFARPHLPFCVPKKYWNLYDPKQLPMPAFEEGPKGAPKWAVKRRGEISQFTPIPETADSYDEDLKRKLIHGYYASVSYMDAQLGRVLNELKRLDLDENTIIVLWGDHGWHLGDHGIWTKHTNYEQALRIPILMKVPGLTTSGVKTNQLIETVDIYPTLVDLAGLEMPQTPQPIDGISMKSILSGGKQSLKDHIYHCYPRGGKMGQAIRTERYRLVSWYTLNNPELDRTYELYDYEADVLETVNIYEESLEVAEKLHKILASYPLPVAPLKK